MRLESHNTWTTKNLHHGLFTESPLVVVPALRDVYGILGATDLGGSVDLISKCVDMNDRGGGCVRPFEAKVFTGKMRGTLCPPILHYQQVGCRSGPR